MSLTTCNKRNNIHECRFYVFEWEYRRQIILIQDVESLLRSVSSGWCGASQTIYTCRDLTFLGVSKWFCLRYNEVKEGVTFAMFLA